MNIIDSFSSKTKKIIRFHFTVSLITLFNFSVSYAQDFRILSQMQLDDNLSVSTLQYDRNDYGIGLLNNKGAMTHEQKFKLYPGDMGKMGDYVFLIGDKLRYNIKTVGYSAILLNKKTLDIAAQQEVVTKSNSNRLSYTLLKDPADNLCYALFRETKYNDVFSFFGPSTYDTKYLETESFQLLSFNNKLESKTIEIKTEAMNSFYADACSDVNKNIYICSFTAENMMIEKFDSTGKLQGKLTSPISLWKKTNFAFMMKNDLINQNCITASFICKNGDKKLVHNVINFDFNTNKVLRATEDILNKEYRANLKNPNEEAKGSNFSSIEDLKLTQILKDSTRIIEVKEIRYEIVGTERGDATTNYRRGSIITVYNKKTLEVERDFVIDKKFASFVEQSEGIYAHLVGNNLYAVTCENTGLTSFKTFVIKINLTTGEVIKTEIEKEDIGRGMVTFPTQVGWYKKEFVIPFFKIKSPFSYSFKSEFLSRTY